MVAENNFRQDLYYRINVVNINLPPLRRRLEDIPLLVDRFIGRLNRIKGKSIQGIDQDVLSILMAHTYPGNIRELENIIEHTFVLCNQGNIGVSHLPLSISSAVSRSRDLKSDGSALSDWDEDPVKAAKIQYIMDVLKRNNYNRQKAAQDMGIHKSTLFRQIKRLGITIPSKF